MNEQGIIGVLSVWVLAGISALCFSLLQLSGWQHRKLQTERDELRCVYLAAATFLRERDSDFASAENQHDFQTGRSRVVRLAGAQETRRLRCEVQSGRAALGIITEWKKQGAGWALLAWAEDQ